MDEPTDRPTRRISKGERTRARIVDSAAALFSKTGFHAVSLRDIAAHAGLTHAGVLHHFPGKEALLLEVLGRRDEIDAAVLFDVDPAAEPLRAVELAAVFAERNESTPGLVDLYAKISAEAADPDHPAHDYFIRRYRVLRQQFTTAFTALKEQGRLRPEVVPAQAAGQLLALMDGLQIQWLLDAEAVSMRSAVEDFLGLLGVEPNRP